MFRLFIFLISLFLFLPTKAQKIYPKRELRGVWIATVLNIDWPTSKNQSPETQRRYFQWILDEHQKNGINAIFVQVRTASDALYASNIVPWSEWLTGQQGKCPRPYYDPLKFMISQAHQRGMEFHAWLNPYRASLPASVNCEQHITKTHPEFCVKYGKNIYLNPGLPQVRQHIRTVVADLVKHYDIDGIHFDDYFYPYPIKNIEFNDHQTFRKYRSGIHKKADWRRRNISLMIESVAKEIRRLKPYVKFGISPSGVWRNKKNDPSGSPTHGLYTAYDNLYADVRYWLSKGWIDYVVPQIYFSFEHKLVAYGALTKWWFKNTFQKHLYIGQSAYKIRRNQDKSWYDISQLPRQIKFNRKSRFIKGSVYFSSKSLTQNYGQFRDSLRLDLNKYPALIPTMPWKDNMPPNPPQNLQTFNTKSGVVISWEKPKKTPKLGNAVRYYVIYRIRKGRKINLNNPRNILKIHHERDPIFLDKSTNDKSKYIYLVTAFDRLHNESKPAMQKNIEFHPPTAHKYHIDTGNITDFLHVFLKIYIKYNQLK